MAAMALSLGRPSPDEGAAAHIFQVLAVLQIGFITAFIASSKDKSLKRLAPTVGLQVLFLATAILIARLQHL